MGPGEEIAMSIELRDAIAPVWVGTHSWPYGM